MSITPEYRHLGLPCPPTYSTWLGELRTLFPVPDEFVLAEAIYSFSDAFHAGWSPQKAYDNFDCFVQCTE